MLILVAKLITAAFVGYGIFLSWGVAKPRHYVGAVALSGVVVVAAIAALWH